MLALKNMKGSDRTKERKSIGIPILALSALFAVLVFLPLVSAGCVRGDEDDTRPALSVPPDASAATRTDQPSSDSPLNPPTSSFHLGPFVFSAPAHLVPRLYSENQYFDVTFVVAEQDPALQRDLGAFVPIRVRAIGYGIVIPPYAHEEYARLIKTYGVPEARERGARQFYLLPDETIYAGTVLLLSHLEGYVIEISVNEASYLDAAYQILDTIHPDEGDTP